MKVFKWMFLLILMVSLFFSCIRIQTKGTSGRPGKYIEDFFIGNGVFQYFIKPLKYESDNNKKASLDATIRNKNKETDSLSINFTVILKSRDKINKVLLSNNIDKEISITPVIETFVESSRKGGYNHRSNFKLPYTTYKRYLLNRNHSIIISNTSEKVTITPSKKTKKGLIVINESLINKLK